MDTPKPLNRLPRCALGEGPWWDATGERLYWVDISGRAIHRWTMSTSVVETHDVDAAVGFVVLDTAGHMVAGVGGGIVELAFGTAHRRLLAQPEMHPDNRFNDGACDPRGRLWAGTMHAEASRDRIPSGALYRWAEGRLDIVERDIGISNGLGWSPDGTVMYFAETHRGIVWAYDYDLDTGRAGTRRAFAEIPTEIGVPDGLTVDSAGRVIVAIWRGARLNVYAPDGALDRVIATPVSCPTSCCHGGPGLKTLYISTNAREGEPLSGYLLAMEVDVPGLPCVPMAG